MKFLTFLFVPVTVLGGRTAVEVGRRDESPTKVNQDKEGHVGSGDTDKRKISLAEEKEKDAKLKAKNLLDYGYFPCGASPNFLKRSDKALFDLRDDEVQKYGLPQLDLEFLSSESLVKNSHAISAQMELSAESHAFSGALGASMKSGSSSAERQMMMIMMRKQGVARYGFDTYHLEKKLNRFAEELIKREPAEKIVEELGEFYMSQMTMGGVIRARFQQEESYGDSYSDFEGKIRASFGSIACKAAASGGVQVQGSVTGSAKSLHVKIQAAGGEVGKILRYQGGDFETMVAPWASSLDQKNATLSPIQSKLRPIWEVVRPVDEIKAQEVQNYLEKLWRDRGVGLEGLDSKPAPKPFSGIITMYSDKSDRNAFCSRVTVSACQQAHREACHNIHDYRCPNFDENDYEKVYDETISGWHRFWGTQSEKNRSAEAKRKNLLRGNPFLATPTDGATARIFGGFELPPGLCVTWYDKEGCSGSDMGARCCDPDEQSPCDVLVMDTSSTQRAHSWKFKLQQGLRCA